MIITHLDLFSGIGGFALAAKMVGHIDTLQFVECDPNAQSILRKNFSGIPIHEDITTYEPDQSFGLVTGGYPCQPTSLAGRREGESDDRWLWPEMLRVIRAARPSWVVCENVVGHVTLGLDGVLLDLEDSGYSARPLIVPACAVDAPHIRERVWVLAHSAGEGLQGREVGGVAGEEARGGVRASTERLCDAHGGMVNSERLRKLQPQGGVGQLWRRLGDSGAVCGLAYADGTAGREVAGCTHGDETQHERRDAESNYGFAGYGEGRSSWHRTGRIWCADGKVRRIKPGLPLLANGIPGRVGQIRGYGNAIVPQVAAMILAAIVKTEMLLQGANHEQ